MAPCCENLKICYCGVVEQATTSFRPRFDKLIFVRARKHCEEKCVGKHVISKTPRVLGPTKRQILISHRLHTCCLSQTLPIPEGVAHITDATQGSLEMKILQKPAHFVMSVARRVWWHARGRPEHRCNVEALCETSTNQPTMTVPRSCTQYLQHTSNGSTTPSHPKIHCIIRADIAIALNALRQHRYDKTNSPPVTLTCVRSHEGDATRLNPAQSAKHNPNLNMRTKTTPQNMDVCHKILRTFDSPGAERSEMRQSQEPSG